MKDTFIRSCEHWSETSRNEMQNFYSLASVDYKYLAEKIEWKKWFEIHQSNVGNRKLKLLDIACGSGKFPSALNEYANLSEAKILPIEYSFLIHHSFSISEARKVLKPPFEFSAEFETTLKHLNVNKKFMILSGQHMLFMPFQKNQLKEALKRFILGWLDQVFYSSCKQKISLP